MIHHSVVTSSGLLRDTDPLLFLSSPAAIVYSPFFAFSSLHISGYPKQILELFVCRAPSPRDSTLQIPDFQPLPTQGEGAVQPGWEFADMALEEKL